METSISFKKLTNEQRALIREEIDNDIERLIKEELSISTELSNAANKIISMVEDDMKREKYKPINIDGVSYKEGNIRSNHFGKNIIVHYWYYNFFDKIYYEKQRKRIKQINRNNNIDKIDITIFAISGYIDVNTLHDTIYHELEHIFQQTKADKMFTKSDMYEFVAKRKYEVQPENPEYAICDSLYLSYDFEEDAYINGAYGFLMKVCDSYLDVESRLPQTQLYNVIEMLKFYYDIISKHKNRFDNVLHSASYKKFDLNANKLIKRIKFAIERIEKKTKNLKKKVKKDIAKRTGENIIEHKILTKEELENIKRNLIDTLSITNND